VFDALPDVPPLVWGRDESHVGEMWTCNSITSWALTQAGIDTDAIPPPDGGRAPGWGAGRAVGQSRGRQGWDGAGGAPSTSKNSSSG
jgi:hypothetical protein